MPIVRETRGGAVWQDAFLHSGGSKHPPPSKKTPTKRPPLLFPLSCTFIQRAHRGGGGPACVFTDHVAIRLFPGCFHKRSDAPQPCNTGPLVSALRDFAQDLHQRILVGRACLIKRPTSTRCQHDPELERGSTRADRFSVAKGWEVGWMVPLGC